MSWITDTWITNADFQKFRFPANEFEDFDLLLENTVNQVLNSLMGAELYKLFFDNFADESINVVYKALRDGEYYVKQNGMHAEWEGLKTMCQLFAIYSAYADIASFTPIGLVSSSGNNEDKLDAIQQQSIIDSIYKRAIAKYNNAREYMVENKDDFPQWRYRVLDFKSQIRY